jgi:hypothetical protein
MRVKAKPVSVAPAHPATHPAPVKRAGTKKTETTERPKRNGPSLSPAPARHVPIPSRSAIETIDASDRKALSQALIKHGYTEGIANRLVARAPELAARILASPTPGPITLPTSSVSARTPGLVYRGMGTHPYDYDPRFVGEAYGKTQWFGDIITAENYTHRSELATKPPPEGRTKNLTMIVEMQVPEALIETRAGEHAAFNRDQIPDDTLFINRVGVFDYSDVEQQWVPGTLNDFIPVPKLKWHSYDEVFDENGKARHRPDF